MTVLSVIRTLVTVKAAPPAIPLCPTLRLAILRAGRGVGVAVDVGVGVRVGVGVKVEVGAVIMGVALGVIEAAGATANSLLALAGTGGRKLFHQLAVVANMPSAIKIIEADPIPARARHPVLFSFTNC